MVNIKSSLRFDGSLEQHKSREDLTFILFNLWISMFEAIKAEQNCWKNFDLFSFEINYWLTCVCLEAGFFEYSLCENDLTS